MLHFHHLHCEIRFIDIRVIVSIVLLRSILAVPNTYMSFLPLSLAEKKKEFHLETMSFGALANIPASFKLRR